MQFLSRKKRKRISGLILLAYVVLSIFSLNNAVFCVGSDGHASIEFGLNGTCETTSEDIHTNGNIHETISVTSAEPDDSHCGECIDSEMSIDTNRIRNASNKTLLLQEFYQSPILVLGNYSEICPDRILLQSGEFDRKNIPNQHLLTLETVVILS